MDRYTVRRVVNDLIDALINQGITKYEIAEMDFFQDLTDAEKDYLDICWID